MRGMPRVPQHDHVIVWEFWVRAGCEAEFEQTYGPRGAWAALFAKSAHFRGTQLLRDAVSPLRYLTVDRWSHPEAFGAFRAAYAKDYDALDARCEAWTQRETLVGTWTAL